MVSRQELARVALRSAFDVRRKATLSFDDPICVYDAVEKLEVEVWFVPGATFGGMFAKSHNRLFVPVERPPGRRAFTCAHELAHWHFNHGTRIDELDFDRNDHEVPEERLANLFAAYFLMPRHAVESEFRRRSFSASDCDPIELYSVACQLGVGYETLIKHLRCSLNLISHSRMEDFQAIPPKEIRRTVIGGIQAPHLVLADIHWHKVAIDMAVDDVAVIPPDSRLIGKSVVELGNCAYGKIVRGCCPGLTQATSEIPEWAAMIRVSRKNFVGRGAYRHLEDPDENE